MILNALRSVLKPAPYLPEMPNPAEVKTEYHYWRVRTFYSMYIGYVFYYFTRKSFTFITPFLCADLHFDKANIGMLGSILSISYGISKFTSGILCDRSNPRYFMAIGLILTGVCNIVFGFFSSLFILALMWGLNGWFQGWGWPACAKLLTHWFSKTERGTWWSACTTSHTVGGFLIAYLAAYCGQQYGWRMAMFIPGVLSIGVGCFLLNRLRDVPESLGLPSIEKFKGEAIGGKLNSDDSMLSVKRILFDQVLNSKYVWILSISYFFVYLIRSAVNDWGPLYLVETKGYSPLLAAGCISWFEVGGFFGMLLAGWGSDRWFKGRRVPFTVLSAIGLTVSLFVFWSLMPEHFVLESCVVGAIGFFIFGPQMLIGLAAAECVDKKAVSTANGFSSCIANVGAAVAGYPLMKMTELLGWEAFVMALVCCAAAIVIILLPIWSVRTGEELVTKPVEDAPGLMQKG